MQRLLPALILTLSSATATGTGTDEWLPLPGPVGDDQTVWLECGRVYVGTLDLSGRRNVTVTTRGNCGKAAVTPAQPVTGWQKNPANPRLWSARIDGVPLQLEIGGQFMELAHHPNSPSSWLSGQRIGSLQLRTTLPQAALAGATLVWRAADWLIQARTIADYDGQHLQLMPGDDEGFGLLPQTEFYVEGKLWMLDMPGEWVHEHGWLHLWPSDGRSPEGRVWATGQARAIDARRSRDVKIHHVKIFGATRGIDGTDARHLQVVDTEITNSGEEAMLIGGEGARLQRLQIKGSVQHGIRISDDARDVLIADSSIDQAGMLGMPRRSKGAIVIEMARGHRIERNQITRSAYLGIRGYRDAYIKDNTIDRACLRLSDCGGIYVFARDRAPLNVRIEGNRITRLQGRNSYAIYLDDFANGVTVRGNRLLNNPGGMQLHNGFDNLIIDNVFSDSHHEHLLLNETAPYPAIQRNRIMSNWFIARKDVPTFRLWSHHGSRNVRSFADYSANIYVSQPSGFAEVEGWGMVDYSTWQSQLANEKNAHFSVSGSFPKFAGQRKKK